MMRHLLIGVIAALAIGMTGCTSTGRPTAVPVQPDDFAIDVTITSETCDGPYTPSNGCLYHYEVSARWLPATPLPVGITTVVYTVTGGEHPHSSYVEFDGTWQQTYTNPSEELMAGALGARLTGHATYVTVTQ